MTKKNTFYKAIDAQNEVQIYEGWSFPELIGTLLDYLVFMRGVNRFPISETDVLMMNTKALSRVGIRISSHVRKDHIS